MASKSRDGPKPRFDHASSYARTMPVSKGVIIISQVHTYIYTYIHISDDDDWTAPTSLLANRPAHESVADRLARARCQGSRVNMPAERGRRFRSYYDSSISREKQMGNGAEKDVSFVRRHPCPCPAPSPEQGGCVRPVAGLGPASV